MPQGLRIFMHSHPIIQTPRTKMKYKLRVIDFLHHSPQFNFYISCKNDITVYQKTWNLAFAKHSEHVYIYVPYLSMHANLSRLYD